MKTVGAKQQNGSKRAGTVFLDDQAQRIQDFVQRNSGGDHLKKTLDVRSHAFGAGGGLGWVKASVASVARAGSLVMVASPLSASARVRSAATLLSQSAGSASAAASASH